MWDSQTATIDGLPLKRVQLTGFQHYDLMKATYTVKTTLLFLNLALFRVLTLGSVDACAAGLLRGTAAGGRLRCQEGRQLLPRRVPGVLLEPSVIYTPSCIEYSFNTNIFT